MRFGVWGLRFGGEGFEVRGLGFEVWGLGFGVWGLGLGVEPAPPLTGTVWGLLTPPRRDIGRLGAHGLCSSFRKVDVRLPGKRNSNTHGARPVHLIITTIKWIRTRRLSTINSVSCSS